MAAPIVQLAEDIKDYLNTLQFSEVFTAERHNRVREDLSTIQKLEVWVVPKSMETESSTRSADQNLFTVDVVVIDGTVNTDAAIDSKLILVDEVLDALTVKSFSVMQYAGMQNIPLYDGDRIDDQGTFLSVVTCSYKALREQSATPKP